MSKSTCSSLMDSGVQARSVPWLVEVLGIAGLLFVGALFRVPLPFTPTPVTLQTLVVLTVPFLSGRGRALSGIALYLVLGLVAQGAGVSLFAVGSSATYGYLAGFLLAPLVMHPFPRTAAGIALAMLLASLMILLLGTLWLWFLLGGAFSHALALGFAPFVVGDAVKAGMAYALVKRRTDVEP